MSTGRLRRRCTPPSRPRRSWRKHASLAALLLLVTGCVPASPDSDTFEDKAALTVAAALSEVATARVSLEELAEGDTFGPAVMTTFRYSEDGLGAATKAFTELNPPPDDDRLYDRVTALLSEASDLLAQARIAVSRGETGQYDVLVERLKRLAGRLDRLEKQVAS
jgi:hypothetical protein